MIALTLIAFAVIYLIVLILAVLLPKTRKRKALWSLFVLSPIIWTTWDMPIGYLQFRYLCDQDEGLRVLLPINERVSVLRIPEGPGASTFARDILDDYQDIRSVEASNEKYYYVGAFSNYSRRPTYTRSDQRISTEAALIVDPIDEVSNVMGIGPKLAKRMPSKAEFSIERERIEKPIRTIINRTQLKDKRGNLLAKFDRIVFNWTNANHTLYGRSIRTSCSVTGDGLAPMHALIDLVATRSEKR